MSRGHSTKIYEHGRLRLSSPSWPGERPSRAGSADGMRLTMRHGDSELDPPFEVIEPNELRAPIVFDSPHSGSRYPQSFLRASRLDALTLRRSEDAFVDELFA